MKVIYKPDIYEKIWDLVHGTKASEITEIQLTTSEYNEFQDCVSKRGFIFSPAALTRQAQTVVSGLNTRLRDMIFYGVKIQEILDEEISDVNS